MRENPQFLITLFEGHNSVTNAKGFTLHGDQMASLSVAVKTGSGTSAEGLVLTWTLRAGTIRPCRVKAPNPPSISVNVRPSNTVVTLSQSGAHEMFFPILHANHISDRMVKH